MIGSGWHTLVQVGLALAKIRDDRLDKVAFDTFERYCQVKWQYGPMATKLSWIIENQRKLPNFISYLIIIEVNCGILDFAPPRGC